MKRLAHVFWHVILITPILFSLSCVSVGTIFDVENVEKIEEGKTTQSEVINLMGLPLNVRDEYKAGKKRSVYEYAFSDGLGRVNEAVISFDENDIVVSLISRLESQKRKK